VIIGRASNESKANKEKEILKKIEFGPLLSLQERDALVKIVREFAHLFITRHQDLPSITLEEHHIDLLEGAKPIRIRQRHLVPDKASILKAEIDKLLEGGFIIPVKNADWVLPVVIVPKKGGKWRVCVDYI